MTSKLEYHTPRDTYLEAHTQTQTYKTEAEYDNTRTDLSPDII